MLGLDDILGLDEISDAASDAITTTAEAAAGVVVGTVEGVVKSPVVIAEKVIDELESIGDDNPRD